MLGSGISRPGTGTKQPAGRSNVHNDPGFLLCKDRQHLANRPHWSSRIHSEYFIPQRIGEIGGRNEVIHDACIIDQDVHRTEAAYRTVDQLLYVFLHCDVGGCPHHFSAFGFNSFDNFLGLLQVQVGDDHLGPLCRKQLGNRFPHP
ncbi:hypothetical protein D3C76_1115740 [compost metagenome]